MRNNHKTLHYHALAPNKARSEKEIAARAEFFGRWRDNAEKAITQGQRVIKC